MNLSNQPDTPAGNSLCLHCGLCCNGVLFADVQLQPEDDPDRLRSLGLPLKRVSPKSSVNNAPAARAPGAVRLRFPQPCAALDGCRCCIYAERPKYCRRFECALLKKYRAGRVGRPAALRIILNARKKAAKVQAILEALGDGRKNVALGIRVREMARRMDQLQTGKESIAAYGELTLAFHRLNLLLGRRFYP